jgi:hypothetical protein
MASRRHPRGEGCDKEEGCSHVAGEQRIELLGVEAGGIAEHGKPGVVYQDVNIGSLFGQASNLG